MSLMALQLTHVDRKTFQPCYFFSLPDFNELWQNVISMGIITEIKKLWAMLILGLQTM